MTIDIKATALDIEGEILTRSGGLPAGITRANLAADAAFTGMYAAIVAPATGVLATDTALIQAAIDSASHVALPRTGTYVCGNLTITNKTNFVLESFGAKIQWSGTAAGGQNIGIQLVGTLTNVTIRDMVLDGDAVAANGHAGIWCLSGQTFTNIKILNNYITDVTLGISVGADTSGTCVGVLIDGNHLDNIVGTASGSGYGIHHATGTATAAHARIVNNTVSRAQRHSIYQGKGSGVVIANNTIRQHRTGVADSSVRAALVVVRTNDCVVEGNVIDAFYDGGIEIAPTAGFTSRNVVVKGNILTGNQNAVAAIHIGSTAPATDGTSSGVLVQGNLIYSSGVNAVAIRVYSALRSRIVDNMIYALSGTAAFMMVDLVGTAETAGTATYTDDLTVEGNLLYGTGTDTRGIRIDSALATSAAKVYFLHNRITAVGAGVNLYNSTAITNPNIVLLGNPDDLTFSGTVVPAVTAGRTALESLAIGAGGTKVTKHIRITQAIDFPSIAAHSTNDQLVNPAALTGIGSTASILVTPDLNIGNGLMVMGIPTSGGGGIYVRMANVTTAAIDPPSLTFIIDVWIH